MLNQTLIIRIAPGAQNLFLELKSIQASLCESKKQTDQFFKGSHESDTNGQKWEQMNKWGSSISIHCYDNLDGKGHTIKSERVIKAYHQTTKFALHFVVKARDHQSKCSESFSIHQDSKKQFLHLVMSQASKMFLMGFQA